MSPVLYKRLMVFKKCQSDSKQLIINNETLDDRDVTCLIELLEDNQHLTALALEFCNFNISEQAFCQLMQAVASSRNLCVFRITGKPAGYPHKFLIDNPAKLSAIRDLVNEHTNLKQLGLANLIYNRHYIRKIVNDAKENNQTAPLALEFGAVLVDLPRVAAEVDRLNEAAAKAANDKKIDTKLNPQKPHKRQATMLELLAMLKVKLGLLSFTDPKLMLPILL
ncbi:MAG: hypothetical protein K0U12_02200 [Gammaproteobacteria bacterium]|nr:hypothetical protein [Gammaproteobacteria bacterium]